MLAPTSTTVGWPVAGSDTPDWKYARRTKISW